MCSNAIYILPNASDLDGDSFTTSVDGNNSFWVKINPLNMQQLVIYSSLLGPLATDTDYIIGIKLKDSTEAYTLNNFKITVPKYVNPYFDFIRDVKLNTKGISQISYKVNSKFSLNDLAYHISALDCNTNSLVPWIEQDKNVSNSQMVVNTSNVKTSTYCLYLYAQLTCGSELSFKSNNFTISILKPNRAPALTNTIPRIYLYYGERSKVVNLPDHLFTDPDGDDLNFYSSGCIDSNSLNLATTVKLIENTLTLYLYVKKFNIGKCQISIVAEDPLRQNTEAFANVEVLKCASKDCTLCQGPLQVDCSSCVEGYLLELKTGTCLEIYGYQSFVLNSYFRILGFVTSLIILIPILLYRIYGEITLYPILFIQIVIALIFSNNSASVNIKDYFEWLQIYKLDFGFMNYVFQFTKTQFCIHQDNRNFIDIQMYCNGFVISFINTLLIISILFLIKVILNFTVKKYKNYKLLDYLNSAFLVLFSKPFLWWSFHNMLFIFPVSCLFLDLMHSSESMINATISFIVLVLIMICILSSKLNCFYYVPSMINDKNSIKIYTYFHILRSISVICLFCLNSKTQNLISIITFWCTQLSIVIYQIIIVASRNNKINLVKIVLEGSILIWIPFYKTSANFSSRGSEMLKINVDTQLCTLISLSVLISTVIILWPDKNVVQICCKNRLKKIQNNPINIFNLLLTINSLHSIMLKLIFSYSQTKQTKKNVKVVKRKIVPKNAKRKPKPSKK